MSNDPQLHRGTADSAAGGPDEHTATLPTEGQVSAASSRQPVHSGEPHADRLGARLNWLRAGVLGANDGIVSVAGLVVGVAGVATTRGPIFTAGLAGLVAGAVSM